MVNFSPNRYPLEESLSRKKGESGCTAACEQIPGAQKSNVRAQPVFLSHESSGYFTQETATMLI